MNAISTLLALILCVSASPMQESAAALERGRALKWNMRGRAPFRREALRMGAVRSFRAGFKGGGDPETQALCALRSAELLEAGDLAKAALADASEGAAIGPSGWGYRCALLAAGALIEGGRHDEAMTILKPVMAERVPSRFLEAAGVLFGISLNERGQRETAFKVWRAIGESGVSTHARIDAFERWGAEVLKGGDIAGAAGVLHLCRSSMGSAAFEATETGVEVRALLRRSSLATAIRRVASLRRAGGSRL